MEKNTPTKTNRNIAMTFMALNLWQLLFLPILLWTGFLSSPNWLWTLVPCALMTNTLWYLIHEAFHYGFDPDKDVNDSWGRAMAVSFGGPYELLRFGHMMHHRFNGAIYDRPDLYDPAKTSKLSAWFSYYFQLLGGFYLSELLSFVIFFLGEKRADSLIGKMFDENDEVEAEVAKVAKKTFLNRELIITLQRDALFVYGSIIVSLLLYGQAGYWYMPLVILAVRGFLVSFANNLPHYGQKPDDVKHGINLKLPRVMQRLGLNFNHHRTHHHHPTVPWPDLPKQHAQDEDSFDAHYLPTALAQFKGPIPVSKFAQQ